jgi:hypothetical protein
MAAAAAVLMSLSKEQHQSAQDSLAVRMETERCGVTIEHEYCSIRNLLPGQTKWFWLCRTLFRSN